MSESNGHMKRVTCKRRHPNQRVHELLETLYRDAVRTRNVIAPTLKEAISSLEKYPLPLSSGAECAILKGFDDKLCNLIDLHLQGRLSRNKKTKVSEHGNLHVEGPSSPPVEESSLHQQGQQTRIKKSKVSKNSHSQSQVAGENPTIHAEESSDSEIALASKKNRKKKKQLVTNTEKCSFESTFGETNINNAADTDIPSITSSDLNKTLNQNKNSTVDLTLNGEKNNNTTKSDCHDEVCSGNEGLDNYFAKIKAAELYYTSFNETSNFTVCENWDTFSSDDCRQFKNDYEANPRNCFQTVHVINPNVDKDLNSGEPITEIIESSDDDSTVQSTNTNNKSSATVITTRQIECLHELLSCKKCETINTAADAFQSYFKEKSKKDAEEIEKCVLPRKLYKPAYRSGAYAILVALLEQRNECPYRDCLTKEELIQKAQKHTDQSFTYPNLKSDYTAWTNAKRLINKGMIQITNCERRNEDFYTLTAMGRAVATEIIKEQTPIVTVNDVIFHGQRNDRVPSLEDVVLLPPPPIGSLDEEQSSVFIEMPPGTYEIIMLVDKRENFELPVSTNAYCKYEARTLCVGDFLWVARSKKTGLELVLPYIMERKRMDDLSSSIKAGRFDEQRYRLRKCGLKNVLYLVENYKRDEHSLPITTLMQAMANIIILDEFNVVKSDSLAHTLKFLDKLSEKVVHEFLPNFLRGCNKDTNGKELMTFEFFHKFTSKIKPLTVRDTFIKMLLQLKGVSVEKALAITKKYNTPRSLMKAYEKCTVTEGELLLASLKYNNFNRNVGETVSKTIYDLFTKLDF